MRINYRALANDCKQLIREGRDAEREVKAQFDEGVFQPQDFRIKELAEACLGYDFVRACDPATSESAVLEADGVDSTAFSNITGQIVYSRILQGFTNPSLVGTSLVETIPTRLDGEKLPGVTQLGDESEVVGEGMPYPSKGIGEEYLETPSTTKRGFIVPVTKEAIFFDRTNLILQRASQVGDSLALGKEKRILDAVLGEASTFATGGKWKWKGTEYDVYNSTAVDYASYFYVNSHTAALQDYTDLDAVETLFGNMTDPNTQEPVLMDGVRQLLVVPDLKQTARRIINSTETRKATGSSVYTTLSPNDKGDYEIISSPFFKARLAANTTTSWWVGNFKRAFAYMENWPITVTREPTNSAVEFERDIVARFKASERGAVAAIMPHYAVKSTGAG